MKAAPVSRAVRSALEDAARYLDMGDVIQGIELAQNIAEAEPRLAEARALIADCLGALGDLDGADRAATQALDLDRKNVRALVVRGRLLITQGRFQEAILPLRTAIGLDRRSSTAAGALGEVLVRLERPEEARRVVYAQALSQHAPDAVLVAYAEALTALGHPDAADVWIRLARRWPEDAFWASKAAASLERNHRDSEALMWARLAVHDPAVGATAALCLARIYKRAGALDEAEAQIRTMLEYRPDDAEGLRLLSELIWERTADLDQAVGPLNAAIERNPSASTPRVIRAKLLEYADLQREAYESLGPKPFASLDLNVAAVQAALQFDPALALEHARTLADQAPQWSESRILLADALMASGKAVEAIQVVDALLVAEPYNQHAIGLKGSALRCLSDPAATEYSDYQRLVGEWTVAPPAGWSDSGSWLLELASSLNQLHQAKAHPLGQSLRGGSQTALDLTRVEDPVVQSFFKAIDAPIRAHMLKLGRGRDVTRLRSTGRYRVSNAWSVRLQPGGRHENHHHPAGWLSSAFYVSVPPAVDDGDRQGWLQFGQPGLFQGAGLEPEHFIKPEPGKLVLFPSWMWHGTRPFGGEHPRLTIAFDIVPI